MGGMTICLLLLVFSLSQPQGCILMKEDHIISEPTIRESKEWKMVKKCGYERCGALVDFLTGKYVTIRIESYSDEKENLFLISAEFLDTKNTEFKFNPSLATVELADHTLLKAKGFTCSYTITEVNYLRTVSSLSGFIPLNDNACFFLFFDAPPPSVEEQFIFRFNGVTRRGQPFDIPEVIFRKGIIRY